MFDFFGINVSEFKTQKNRRNGAVRPGIRKIFAVQSRRMAISQMFWMFGMLFFFGR